MACAVYAGLLELSRVRKHVGMRQRIYVIGLFLLLGIAGVSMFSPVAAQACAVCGGAAIGTDPGTGFNSSILFLLSMPYVVLGAIAGWLIYTYRRASGRREGSGIPEKMIPQQRRREIA